jgi:hypothetical protein
MPRFVVTLGKQYGRLMVIAPSAERLQGKPTVLVQCACGSPPFLARFDHLRSGHTKSCRCAQREHARRRMLSRWANTDTFQSGSEVHAGVNGRNSDD